jgi:hypothetical protein
LFRWSDGAKLFPQLFPPRSKGVLLKNFAHRASCRGGIEHILESQIQ